MNVESFFLISLSVLKLSEDVHCDLAIEAPFCTLQLVFLFWKKLSQKALDMYSVLLLRISKREMSKLAIVQGEIFG